MSRRSKWLSVAVLAALALVPAGAVSVPADPAAPAAGSLLDLEVDHVSGAGPAVTLLTDTEVAWESFELEDPRRVVVDLSGVISRLEQQRFPVGHDGVRGVRAAQHVVEPVPITRVVVDLDGALVWRVEQDGPRIRIHFGSLAEAAELEAPAVIAEPANELPPEPALAEFEPSARDAAPMVEPEPAEAPAVDEVPTLAEAPAWPEGELQAQAEPVPTLSGDAAQAEAPPAVEPDVVDRLLEAPAYAAPQPAAPEATPAFETKRILTDEVIYTGKRISLNLVDADVKQVFRLFHEISGLNFVLDPGVAGQVTIVLDQVPWDQALDIILKNNSLDKVLENNVLRIASTKKLAEEAASRRQLRDAQELEVEPVTLTRTLSYAKAQSVERVIQNGGILSPRGRVIVDERTNTLIISDVPKKVEPIDSLVSTLDAETPQVMIEARIVETSRSFTRDLGVRWGFTAAADAAHGTSTGLGFPHNATAKYALNLPGKSSASTLAFSLGNIVDSFTLDVALNALENEGQGRILSSPKIATQNNEKAEIEQGVRFPIVNTTATEINVEFVSASLRLSVTPQITAEGTIILDVTVENNSPDFVNTSGDVPSIRTQRAETKVLINDGGTTVIGGIFTVNEGQSEIGVPWFRKLPLFGWLFKSQNITQENRELLIFITPKIVRLG